MDEIIEFDLDAIVGLDPLAIIPRDFSYSKRLLYVSLVESYATGKVKEHIPSISVSTMADTDKSSTILKGEVFQAMFTDNSHLESARLSYDDKHGNLVRELKELFSIFDFLSKGSYEASQEDLSKMTPVNSFSNNNSTLLIYQINNDKYLVFSKGN